MSIASHVSIWSTAPSGVSGLGNALGFVDTRRNPTVTAQAKPMVSSPFSASSHHPMIRS